MLNRIYAIEQNAINFYDSLSNMHEIFGMIKQIREQGITLINECAKGINYDLSCERVEIYAPKSLKDAFVCALNHENELCAKYEKLSDEIDDESIKDICFRLWATSNNEYIPALNECIKQTFNEKTENVNQKEQFAGYENLLNNYQNEFNNMSESLQNIMSGKMDKVELGKILNSPNFSFFSGLALGALGASLLAKNLDEDENDE